MDKYEYRMKTEQMLAFIEAKAYAQAMEIADTIDWRRVKNIIMLCATSEVYEMNGNLEKSREILFIAYDRAPDNKKIIYRLGILALKQGDISEALDCYDEFLVVAPKDPNQYILKYKIQKLQNASLLLQIETLKAFKSVEYVEKWAFELARLYDQCGMQKECMTECDDLILWFSESDYVKEALELKIKHGELTPAQEVIYKQLNPDEHFEKPVSEAVFKDEIVLEEPVMSDVPVDDMGATKIINAEELQQINDAMKQELMQTVAIDSKAVLEAEEKAKAAPPIVVRGTPIVPTVPVDMAAAGVAAAGVSAAIPLKSRTTEVSPETTGQLRIDEMFASWQDKQREMEEAIAEKKAQNEEKVAREAQEREEEKVRKEAEKLANEVQEVPDEVKRILQDMEVGDEQPAENIETEEVIEEVPVIEDVVNKGTEVSDGLYIEEEFHDNTFDAEEEFEQMTADDVSLVQAELDDIEALLQAGDEEEAKLDIELDEATTEAENQKEVEEIAPIFVEEVAEPSRMERAKAVATGRTSKLPTEDIVKALGGVSQDTGYIVQGKYDLEAQSQIGLRAGLTEEQKKLFSYFVPVRGMSEQLVEVLERDKKCVDRNGTSSTGNLLIVGQKGSGKTVLAVDVVKAIQKNRPESSGKVAIVTGEALNKKKISDIVGKLFGGALIIEKASQMNEKTITRLNKAMERETGEILIVLEDERRPLDSLLATNLEFRRRFTSRLEVPVFINDELVTFGQAYAKENGFKIDEMGILALYSKIDREQKDDYSVSVADVKDILDDAMDEAQRGGVKKLAKKIFSKNDETGGRITLSEKHFGL